MGHRFCRRFHPPLIVDPSGSGKTFTMGSEYKPGGRSYGVIPEAIGAIFQRIATIKDYECCVRVSFVEIHKVRPSVLHTRPPARSR
jgi:kinesin family protein 4/21/27